MSKELSDNLKISPEFRNRLSEFIFDSKHKKNELPKLIGVSQAILIRALNVGMIPSTSSLIKIADYFNTSIDYLIGLIDKEDFIKSDNPNSFYERLMELKNISKITECAIASKLGFPRSLFSKWKKRNYIPSLEIAFMLAQFFNVSLDYLLGRTDDK